MDKSLEAEIEEIVDKQLQELGFIDLCTRIAHKVVEKVQNIDEEHSLVKHELDDIEQKLNCLFTEKKYIERPRDLIIIDEDEEKPLVESLHAITKSPTSPSFAFDTTNPFDSALENTNASASYDGKKSLHKNATDQVSRIDNTKNGIPVGSKRRASGQTIETIDQQVAKVENSLGDRRSINSGTKTDAVLLKRKPSHSDKDKKGSEDVHDNEIQQVSNAIDNAISQHFGIDNETAVKPNKKVRSENAEDLESASPSLTEVRFSRRQSEHKEDSEQMLEPASLEVANTDDAEAEQNECLPIQTDKSETLKTVDMNEGDFTDSISVDDFLETKELGEKKEITDIEKADKESTSEKDVVFKAGDQVLAKPEKSDIWYQAAILKDIVNKYGQRKFQIKFDTGQRVQGTLPINNLAPLPHPDPSELSIGSRVTAARPRDTVDARIAKKYISLSMLSSSKADILFSGTVVERACEETKNRFLVFFDDGFAQYLPVKKMHHVRYAADNVWEDVSIHCRDFIKEYLQEFPHRPMVKLKVGQTVQTEWNGRWLLARVLATDGSLVKMLFDIDKRTEWIYRGSTRLEPLYSELERRDLEALKNKNKKSSKKKKATASASAMPVKKNEPYIEDAITDPRFGISRFSYTDPKGIEQMKYWGVTPEQLASSIIAGKPTSSSRSIETEKEASPNLDKTTPNMEKQQKSISTTSLSKRSQKRKLDEDVSSQGSDSSLDIIGLEKGDKFGRNKEEVTNESPFKPSHESSSKASTNQRSPLQRQSSHSSIDSALSDSQSRSCSAKRIRLERQSSNHSVSSNQSDRFDSQTRRQASYYSQSPARSPASRSKANSVAVAQNSSQSSVKVSSETPSPQSRRSGKEGTETKYGVPTNERAKELFDASDKNQHRHSSSTNDSAKKQTSTSMSLSRSFPRVKGPHECTPACIPNVQIPAFEKRKHNPLSVPLLLGWTRETAKRRPGYHRDIYYRSPCNRRLRNLYEVTKYLLKTQATNVTIDQFSFDASVSCRDQLPIFESPSIKIDDISCGKENVPIPCVNERSKEYPPSVVYIRERTCSDQIDLNLDSSFLVCCDCKDNCQDKSKCACSRLTIDSSDAIDGTKNQHAGYQYRRLKECVTTGIYECNSKCSCYTTCYNRVVQNGIGIRLQVFMTDNKGWGLRCLDDIPRGTFICTYAGQILNEEMADKEGTDFGDEYLAELDHIEVVEQAKEGYEADVPELRQENKTCGSNYSEESNIGDDSDSDKSDFAYSYSSDGSENPPLNVGAVDDSTKKDILSSSHQNRSEELFSTKLQQRFDDVIDLTLESDDEDEISSPKDPDLLSSPSSLEDMIKVLRTRSRDDSETNKGISPRSYFQRDKLMQPSSELKLNVRLGDHQEEKYKTDHSARSESFPVVISDDESRGSDDVARDSVTQQTSLDASSKGIIGQKLVLCEGSKDNDQSTKFIIENAAAKSVPRLRRAVARKSSKSIIQLLVDRKAQNAMQKREEKSVETLHLSTVDTMTNSDVTHGIATGKTFTSPRSSTGGHFARKLTANRLQVTPPNQTKPGNDVVVTDVTGTRRLFGDDRCYVIDAKSFGNVGRFLNHSCMPNLFVQNVFLDTHDLRFPLVAFFAQQNIPALTELTWDYSYEVGSVPGKVLKCHCGAIECRKRLL